MFDGEVFFSLRKTILNVLDNDIHIHFEAIR